MYPDTTMSQQPIILLHLNYDYDETFASFDTPKDVCAFLAETFEIDLQSGACGHSRANALYEAYEAGDWKGFDLAAIDRRTGCMVSLDAAELFDAERSAHSGIAWTTKISRALAESRTRSV